MKSLFIALALSSVVTFAQAITAKAYIVTDMDGNVLLEKNADDVRSIASITKLITTRSAAAYDQNELITITSEDVKAGRMRSSLMRVGQSYSRAQLTLAALVYSDNVAAIALGRTLQYPPESLPEGMHWVEGSGLDPANVGSARELATIARSLVDTQLAKDSVTPSITMGTGTRKSTNPLIGKPGWDFDLSKTGFINEAGECVVSVFQAGSRKIVAVVLGSRNVQERWRDLYDLRRQLDPDSVFASPSGRVFVQSAGRVTKRKHRYN